MYCYELPRTLSFIWCIFLNKSRPGMIFPGTLCKSFKYEISQLTSLLIFRGEIRARYYWPYCYMTKYFYAFFIPMECQEHCLSFDVFSQTNPGLEWFFLEQIMRVFWKWNQWLTSLWIGNTYSGIYKFQYFKINDSNEMIAGTFMYQIFQSNFLIKIPNRSFEFPILIKYGAQ